MGYRLTAALVVILTLLGFFTYFFTGKKNPSSTELGPEVWSIEEQNIVRLDVVLPQQNLSASFIRLGEEWRFNDPQKSRIDPDRWGGIPTLVTGPASGRILRERADNLSEYGFDQPRLRIFLGIRDGADFEILVGDRTPDETHCFVKVRNRFEIYTISNAWSDVLARLATEPPRLKTAKRG